MQFLNVTCMRAYGGHLFAEALRHVSDISQDAKVHISRSSFLTWSP